MNLSNLGAARLRKIIRKFRKQDPRPAAQEWARRIESGPKKSCIPKAKLRRAGLIPKVGDLLPAEQPKSMDDYPGMIVSDGESYFMLIRLIENGETVEGQEIQNPWLKWWWGVRYPDGKARIPVCIYQDQKNDLTWHRRAKHENQTVDRAGASEGAAL
jgi:hypothetical protein